MQSCPKCLGELHPGPPGEAMAEYLAAGGHLYRAEDVAPFAGGPECTVLRLAPRSRLVLTGGDGLVEASLVGNDIGAVPPLACEDFGGTPLFRLTRYAAADRALTAAGPDGSSLATFLLHDGGVDVRDETSAPVARLVRNGVGGEWELVETGGRRLATMSAIDHRQEGCVDDEWTLRLLVPRLPLQPFAAVAMVAAAKILLGRAWPEVHELELQQE